MLHNVVALIAVYLHFWQTHVRRSRESDNVGRLSGDHETRWKIWRRISAGYH